MLPLAERIVAAALLAASFTAAAALPSNWSIADLDGLPGEPKGISDSGFVVGCHSVGTTNRAFILSNGVSRELSPELPAGSSSCAYAVNNAGMVAGVVDGQVAVWTEAGLSRLPITGVPHGINEGGVVVGAITSSTDPRAPTHAFMWRQGVVTELHPAAAQTSAAYAINNPGQVAGTVDSTAVIWENGGMRTIGSGFITVGAMNDFGEVVGLYLFGNENKARGYIFNRTLSGLPGVGSELSVLTITNGGRVLVNGVDSYTTVIENGERLSFEFMPSIRAAGWKRLEPRAMNNRGWIVGYGNHDGMTRKFLITPLDIAAGVNPLARPSVRNAPLIRARSR